MRQAVIARRASWSGSNYQVQPIGSEFLYLLNVCHDLNPEDVVVNGTIKRCPLDTEICQINTKDASHPVRDLGHFPDGPMVPTVLARNLLMFNYTGGDVCPRYAPAPPNQTAPPPRPPLSRRRRRLQRVALVVA